MSKQHAPTSVRILSLTLVLALLVAVSSLASAQPRAASTTIIELAKLTATDVEAEDWFSYYVSISGDTVVLGAPQHDGDGAGAAYLFERDEGGPGNWGQVAKLNASDAAAGDDFGWSVSISGNTVVVGAPRADEVDTDSGAAYLFQRDTDGLGNWDQVAKITASDGNGSDGFGWSVSISGDTVVVGAPFDDDNGDLSGSAYVFERPQSGWTNVTETAKLTASDGTNLDYLGRSVAVSGDTVVAGAQGAAYVGSAYLFVKPDSGWVNMSETVQLMSSDGATEDRFGGSVSLSGDTLVVGAPGDDDGGFGSGSAYLFERNAGGAENWGQVAKLTASDPDGGDQLGGSVSISGDTVVAGAVFDEDLGEGSGSAYLFREPLAGWTNMSEMVKLSASDGSTEDHFGYSVSLSGDTLAVGAPGSEERGATYMFFSFTPVTSVYLPVVLRAAP